MVEPGPAAALTASPTFITCGRDAASVATAAQDNDLDKDLDRITLTASLAGRVHNISVAVANGTFEVVNPGDISPPKQVFHHDHVLCAACPVLLTGQPDLQLEYLCGN